MANESKFKTEICKFDSKEFELPETLFIRDIENRVIQGIVLQCLASIDGIALIEGNFIDHLFSRTSPEGIKGIRSDQDNNKQSVKVEIQVSIRYGIPIPEKAEEMQTKLVQEISRLTGLHVSSVHIVFKNILPPEPLNKQIELTSKQNNEPPIEEEYEEGF